LKVISKHQQPLALTEGLQDNAELLVFKVKSMSAALSHIELIAGIGPAGAPVVERLEVHVNAQNECQLVRSPAFVKGIASGDVIKLTQAAEGAPQFELVRRSGNLAVRVMSKGDTQAISERLTPLIEQLGGELDVESPRLLIYSLHVSLGFSTIETLLNNAMDESSVWVYGNVYDPADGTTPLNWWHEVLDQV
jgi:hypothetical protein